MAENLFLSEEYKKEIRDEILSLLTSSLKKDCTEFSEEERDVLEKTAVSYCEGIPNTDANDLKELLQFSKANFLCAYGEIEEATKTLTERLEATSKRNHLFTKGLITFYSKEDEIQKIEKSLQSFRAFFSENAKILWKLKSPENNDDAFILIIAQ